MRQAVLLCYLQILRQFLISVTTSGIRRTCAYDANNQPLGINIPGAGSVAYNQYQWTRPQSVTLPDGGTSQYAYDELMRTKAITKKDYAANPQMNYAYTYDKMDNIKTRNTQNGNYAYNYDNLYRLNEVKKDTQQTEAYTYDQVGNRLTSAVSTGDWTYNSNNELLSLPGVNGQSSSATYQYDANGNTIQKTVNGQIQNYVYNADNRLVEVKDATNNTIAKYTYDPFGRRIKKTVSGGAGTVSPSGGGSGEVTTYYLYSDEGLIGEYDSTGAEIKTYGYKPNSTWSTDPVFCHSREGGNPGYYFYHNDHLGTPQKMTNLSGAIVWSATYDAFGKASVDAGSSITNNLRFPGQYFDAETGLHYNYHRYYDPNAGRYVTEDPIGFRSGLNLFSYVFNNPTRFLDALGLKVTYGVHTIGASAIAVEVDVGFAYAESDCKNGKKYVAIYGVGAGGINVGLELKLGKLFKIISKISEVVSNAKSLLKGDTFTLEGDVPEYYLSYYSVGAGKVSLIVTGKVIDINIGPYEGGRKPEDPMFNGELSGDIGVSLSSCVGYNLKRVYMTKKDCCERVKK